MGWSVQPTLSTIIDRMPKVELHVHLEGAAEPQTLFQIAETNGLPLSLAQIESIRRPAAHASFDSFAKAFLLTVQCVRRLDDFALLAFRHGEAMRRQNIRYAEVTWTPQLYGHLRLPLDAILEALNTGRAQAREAWGVEMRWIPDLVRSYPKPALAVQGWACSQAARDGGVVALGLGGPESETLAPEIREAFVRARAASLPANPHAGEAAGPASVWLALRELSAVRIGHGVRSLEDPALLEYLAERPIALEVCPTSNVSLRVCDSYEKHPLKRLLAAGCRVTVNSDDPALFGSDLSREYRHAVEDCGLTVDELWATVIAAANSTYLPHGARKDLERTLQEAFDRE